MRFISRVGRSLPSAFSALGRELAAASLGPAFPHFSTQSTLQHRKKLKIQAATAHMKKQVLIRHRSFRGRSFLNKTSHEALYKADQSEISVYYLLLIKVS